MKARLTAGVALAMAVMAVLSTQAAIHYQQDFDTMVLGNVNGQQGWSGAAPLSNVQNAVAVSGNALETGNGAYAAGYFNQPFATGKSNQWLSFDIRLSSDIYDHAGTPNVDMQVAFAVRGPSAYEQTYFVYKAATNGLGAVDYSRWEQRAASILTSPDVRKDIWYSVLIKYDFDANTSDAEVLRAGQAWWNPAVIAGFQNNGNTNDLFFETDNNPNFSIFVDNILIIPEPATAGMLTLAGLLALRRRR